MSIATDTRKENMIIALTKSLGIVSTACKEVGIDRSTHYGWIKDDSTYKQAVDDISESAIDFAESKLFEKMNGVTVDSGKVDDEGELIVYKREPSDTALIFYLKTKGKSRGYVERTEQIVADASLDYFLSDD